MTKIDKQHVSRIGVGTTSFLSYFAAGGSLVATSGALFVLAVAIGSIEWVQP
ncbi:hypothetical protein [Rhodococcus sp. JVH1]|uniref:hypothetical protein n=1 Tax=Rhodococcus sp. JVH1 TaxID=745408 RepID=UPI000271EF39|nr:hypothetical protein [Rhodococcus sp. JVH1]EJI98657.1 hypothetical protein JVH1_3913 [Rhodococcus sp. JVH1]